jgi:DNA-binding beta-propeller fold protein YncE
VRTGVRTRQTGGRPSPNQYPVAAVTAAVAAALVLIGNPPAAVASTGQITPIGCISSSAQTACQLESRLGEPFSVETSPDGRSVYVTNEKGIAEFSRDPATGQVAYQGCIGVADSGCEMTGLPDPVEWTGLPDLVKSIAISPDGESVYALASRAIVQLVRDPATGRLTFKDCVASFHEGPAACSQRSRVIRELDDIVISPDGRSIYVTTSADSDFGDPGALVRLVRDQKSGRVHVRSDCIQDPDWTGQAQGCPEKERGFYDPGGMALSPNGKSLYVTSPNDQVVHILNRNRRSGRLSTLGCVEDSEGHSFGGCARRIEGLGSPGGSAVSPDGRSVYLHSGSSLFSLRRDSSGRLRGQSCIGDSSYPQAHSCPASGGAIFSLFRPDVLVSSDGASVYTGSDIGVGIFARLHSGKPTVVGCLADTPPPGIPSVCSSTTDGLNRTWSIAISPDGRTLYAVSQDDALVTLARS